MRTKHHLETDCQGPAARTLASYRGSPWFNLGPEILYWGPSCYSSVFPRKNLEATSRQPTRTSFHITSNPAFINHPTTHAYALRATGSVVKLTITKIKIRLTAFLAAGDRLDFMSPCLSGPKECCRNISQGSG